MIAVPFEEREIFAVDIVCQVLALHKITRAHPRDGNEGHQSPISDEQAGATNDHPFQPESSEDQTGEEIAERKPLQNSQQPNFFNPLAETAVIENSKQV